jgi:CHAD domain-containing protein
VTTTGVIERELKFEVESNFVVPDLKTLLPKGGSIQSTVERLRSDYFDTADLALLHANITLRRRTGSVDQGWQLKVPHEQFREEIRVDLAGDDVPDELARLLTGVLRDQPLAHVATITTRRSVTRLLDADRRALAEIDDDIVHTSVAAAATITSWREVEVELATDDVTLLRNLGRSLRRAGARPSASASKLAQALHGGTPQRKSIGAGAVDVVDSYIAEQQRQVLLGDVTLRRGNAAVVHQTRVATRRLRSALRVFGSVFDNAEATALDAELRWWAGELGEVRDRQVMRTRLNAMIDDVDETLLLGPVRARVDAELDAEIAEHWATLQKDLAGERYRRLLVSIDAWVKHPPHRAKVRVSAATIAGLVHDADRLVARRLAKANATGDIGLMHSARKAAKRARYAAEAAQSVIGKKAATRQTVRYRQLQDLLGEHQDSLVSAELLRRLGIKAGAIKGENGFAFGVLHEREAQAARTARAKAKRAARASHLRST